MLHSTCLLLSFPLAKKVITFLERGKKEGKQEEVQNIYKPEPPVLHSHQRHILPSPITIPLSERGKDNISSQSSIPRQSIFTQHGVPVNLEGKGKKGRMVKGI